MRKLFAVVALAAITLCPALTQAQANKTAGRYFKMPATATADDYVANTVCFRLKEAHRTSWDGTTIALPAFQSVMTIVDGHSLKQRFPHSPRPEKEFNDWGARLVDLSLIFEVNFNAGETVEDVVNRLYHTGLVEWAEPHYIDKLDYTVNDPQLSQQYHINKINAPDAWDITQGDTSIVIAIVDSGTDPDHPDLEPNFKYNHADPINGVDDDNDGYIDNYLGWDFPGNDNDPEIVGSNHGVHVQGCAAPATDNGTGVAGPGFNCRIMPVRAGDGTLAFGYEGVTYAADHGADVINCSWGGGNFSNAALEVIEYATINQDALVVAAAGNDNGDLAHYPSSYNYVLSVASTDQGDSKSNFSTYHHSVDVSAPGSNIFATYENGTYGFNSGTSMASPVAAGAAALVKSRFPFFNALQIGEQLRTTCDDIYAVGSNSLYTGKLGSGRVNLAAAVDNVTSSSIRMTERLVSDGEDEAFVAGDTLTMIGTFVNYLATSGNVDVTLTTSSPFVNMVDGTTSLGSLGTMQSVQNDTDPFRLVILPNAPLNTVADFEVFITDGNFSRTEFFSLTLNVDYVNIAINEVSTSITSKGLIGFNDFSTQLEGLGFRYLEGENLLFEGGVMIGAESGGSIRVSDFVRGEGTDTDSDFDPVINAYQLAVPTVSEIDVKGRFDDSNAPTPLDVTVNHKAHAWSTPGHTKYVIVEYTIVNDGAGDLNDLYTGIFCDWDIQEFDHNKGATDNVRRMGYCYNTDVGGFYAGVQLISTNAPFIHYAVDHIPGGGGGLDLSDGYTPQEKYTSMSTARATSGDNGQGNDVFNVVSTGPFDIAPGDSVTVAFALLAGDDLNDLQTSADSSWMQQNDSALSVFNFAPATQAQLFQPVPNPASNMTALGFYLPEAARANLMVMDVLGNVVATLEDAKLPRGEHRYELNVSNLRSGVYFYRLNVDGVTQTRKFTVAR